MFFWWLSENSRNEKWTLSIYNPVGFENIDSSKKGSHLQSLITQTRAELAEIIKDPLWNIEKFENAQRSINVWFEGYIQWCEKILKDVEVREEFKEYALFM